MTDALLALIAATALLLGSPGPATMSLAATGAVFGFRRGLPYLAGILAGLAAAVALGAAGLEALFAAFPASRGVVRIAGAAYIVYIAWRIATAPIHTVDSSAASAAPRFRDGFVLNLLNVKAYAAMLALFSQFQLPFAAAGLRVAATAGVAYLVTVLVDIAWLGFGGLLKPALADPRRARIARIVFAALVLLSLLFAFRPG